MEKVDIAGISRNEVESKMGILSGHNIQGANHCLQH